MSDGRTVWWPKDSAWWRREVIVELGEEFGTDGPAVLDWLSCEAKAQNDAGMVKAGYRTVSRGCFVQLVTVRHVVSRAVQLGALDDFEETGNRFTCRISGWAKDNERGRASIRQAEARARANGAVEPTGPNGHAVTERDVSRPVTPRHAESPTGQDRTEEEYPPNPPRPAGGIGRKRDREKFEIAQREVADRRVAFARQHFPDVHPDAVLNTAALLWQNRREATVETLTLALRDAGALGGEAA